MLTVMHQHPDGSEVIRDGALSVSRIRETIRTLDGAVDCLPGVRVRWDDESETHYNEPQTGEAGKYEAIYVMNRFGATVATYRL